MGLFNFFFFPCRLSKSTFRQYVAKMLAYIIQHPGDVKNGLSEDPAGSLPGLWEIPKGMKSTCEIEAALQVQGASVHSSHDAVMMCHPHGEENVVLRHRG